MTTSIGSEVEIKPKLFIRTDLFLYFSSPETITNFTWDFSAFWPVVDLRNTRTLTEFGMHMKDFGRTLYGNSDLRDSETTTRFRDKASTKVKITARTKFEIRRFLEKISHGLS
jgi:hypothetical protein